MRYCKAALFLVWCLVLLPIAAVGFVARSVVIAYTVGTSAAGDLLS